MNCGKTAQQSVADPGHIGRTDQDHRLEEQGWELGQHADRQRAEQGMNRAAQHDACHRSHSCLAAARQRIGKDEEHVHARHDDDAEQQDEIEPERLGVVHDRFPG